MFEAPDLLDDRAADDDDDALHAASAELYAVVVANARGWLAERTLAARIDRAHGRSTREFSVCAVRAETGGTLDAAQDLITDAWLLRSLPLTRGLIGLGLLTASHARVVLRVLDCAGDDTTRQVEAAVLGRWLGDTLRARRHELPAQLATEVDEALLALTAPRRTAPTRPARAAEPTPACPHEQQVLDLAIPSPRSEGTPETPTTPTAPAVLDDPPVSPEEAAQQRPEFCAGRTPTDLRRALVRALRRIDADEAARRRRDTERHRILSITPEGDTGLATLSFLTNDVDAARIRAHAYAVAKARNAAGLGSPDGLDATANDVVRDYLLALAHPDPVAELLRLREGLLPDALTPRRPVHITVIIPPPAAPSDRATGDAPGGPSSDPGDGPADGPRSDPTSGGDAAAPETPCRWDTSAVTGFLRDGTPLHDADLRALLAGARVRRAVTDSTGRVTAVDDRDTVLPPDPNAVSDALARTLGLPLPTPPEPTDAYQPTAGIARVVDARWRHCCAPGCRRPAEQCDRDHRIPHHLGGATCPCNLAPLCRTHHRAKQAGWTPTLHPDGWVTWTSPHGRATRHPPPWDDDHL